MTSPNDQQCPHVRETNHNTLYCPICNGTGHKETPVSRQAKAVERIEYVHLDGVKTFVSASDYDALAAKCADLQAESNMHARACAHAVELYAKALEALQKYRQAGLGNSTDFGIQFEAAALANAALTPPADGNMPADHGKSMNQEGNS